MSLAWPWVLPAFTVAGQHSWLVTFLHMAAALHATPKGSRQWQSLSQPPYTIMPCLYLTN